MHSLTLNATRHARGAAQPHRDIWCEPGGDMVFILDLHVPFCLALLYFYLLWLLKLSLLYLTPVAQYDSVAMLISIMSGPIREP